MGAFPYPGRHPGVQREEDRARCRRGLGVLCAHHPRKAGGHRRQTGIFVLLASDMASIKIYHNPSCGTSRNTLALIRNSGEEPQVIEYLKTPPSRDELVRL